MAEKWLSCDPGEDTGWALWEGENLIDAGTEKLWAFGESIYAALHDDLATLEIVGDEFAAKFVGIERIVAEDFRIYPWEAKKGTLNWDQVRTARLIGALTLLAKMKLNEPIILQGAKIKERAEAAGAEALFLSPRNENRHANDAIRHGVYWLAVKRGIVPVNQIDGDDWVDAQGEAV